jgi:tRNA-splicing ligase RtcB
MTAPLEKAGIVHSRVSGHSVTSVSAIGEPDSQKRRAYTDLVAALPDESACRDAGVYLKAIATTPDFHPGKPVPVGLVADIENGLLPHLIGNDIGCGMRMIVVEGIGMEDLPDTLEHHLRHIYFQGGRDIALTGRNRQALLKEGLPGLCDSFSSGRKGLLAKLDLSQCWSDLDRTCDAGVFNAADIDPDFAHYASLDDDLRHDAILGTIGGGNHFVEFGRVETVVDGAAAMALGVSKSSLVIVIHSGSLDFGQRIGSVTRERLAERKGQHLDHRLLSIEAGGNVGRRFVMGQANAVNAAFANRFFLALQAVEALSRALRRDLGFRTIYDAPHNAIWIDEEAGINRHRKGACPARGAGSFPAVSWLGEPVILPGSMGDGSWLLAGRGKHAMLQSSAHGAGRKLSRQDARKAPSSFERLRVVGPVDLDDPMLRSRPDILDEAFGRLREEAPAAYRPIDDVVDAMCAAEMVSRVARIRPLLTVKG